MLLRSTLRPSAVRENGVSPAPFSCISQRAPAAFTTCMCTHKSLKTLSQPPRHKVDNFLEPFSCTSQRAPAAFTTCRRTQEYLKTNKGPVSPHHSCPEEGCQPPFLQRASVTLQLLLLILGLGAGGHALLPCKRTCRGLPRATYSASQLSMCHVGVTDLSQVDGRPVAKLSGKVAELMAAVAVCSCVHPWESPVPCHNLRKLWPLSLQADA